MTATYQRIQVRIVRVGPDTTHVSVPTYAAGQILVPVPTFEVMSATGMTRAQLTGADLRATANVTAPSDADVHLHDWQAPTSDTGADRSASREAGQREVVWGSCYLGCRDISCRSGPVI